MKYIKLIVAILIALVISVIGYSLIVTMDMDEKRPEVDSPMDTVISVVAKEPKTSRRDSLVSFALQYLETPYVYGSCNKDGFDCSGFVYFVYKHFNMEVPRSSSEYKIFGKEVDIDQVRKGDILVFLSPTRNEIGHLGIVTKPNGMETEFIHSSSGKEMMVIISSLKQEAYKKRFVKAVEVI